MAVAMVAGGVVALQCEASRNSQAVVCRLVLLGGFYVLPLVLGVFLALVP